MVSNMIDKKEFSSIRRSIEDVDNHRELLIKKSRAIVKKSKVVITAIHRDAISSAKKSLSEMEGLVKAFLKEASRYPELRYGSQCRIALQEYVEAAALYTFATEGRLIRKKELGVDSEQYILGVCDLTGELVRMAINNAIKGKYENAVIIKDFVSEIYAELLKFAFGNGDMRRKFDGIKYALNKLENLVFELHMKGKV